MLTKDWHFIICRTTWKKCKKGNNYCTKHQYFSSSHKLSLLNMSSLLVDLNPPSTIDKTHYFGYLCDKTHCPFMQKLRHKRYVAYWQKTTVATGHSPATEDQVFPDFQNLLHIDLWECIGFSVMWVDDCPLDCLSNYLFFLFCTFSHVRPFTMVVNSPDTLKWMKKW